MYSAIYIIPNSVDDWSVASPFLGYSLPEGKKGFVMCTTGEYEESDYVPLVSKLVDIEEVNKNIRSRSAKLYAAVKN